MLLNLLLRILKRNKLSDFQVTKEQLHYARLKVGQDSVWELFAEDGEMRMYKREEEVDGMVCDPLKALHQVSISSISVLIF